MAFSEFHRLDSVLVKHARAAFVDEQTIAREWPALNFSAPPDFGRAIEECDRFIDILQSAGARVHLMPRDARATIDSIYARDASIVTPRGVVLCSMGKASRHGEPDAQAETLERLGGLVAGRITPPGSLEGGDLIWLDEANLAVGRGYRTNAEGIRQLRDIVGPSVHVHEVGLPHWRGPGDVMHLMSLISPLDCDLAAVYSPLLPVPFREWLLDRAFKLVEVPDAEFESMGTNVLALAPRLCLILKGNPLTRRALEKAQCEVREYDGAEISVKGAGGPTCLTRPLTRVAG